MVQIVYDIELGTPQLYLNILQLVEDSCFNLELSRGQLYNFLKVSFIIGIVEKRHGYTLGLLIAFKLFPFNGLSCEDALMFPSDLLP